MMDTMGPANQFWDSYDRLNKAKRSGVKGQNDLCELLIKEGDLGANSFKLGKMDEPTAKKYVEDNPKNDYIGVGNKNLALSARTVKQAFNMAGLVVEEKNTTVGEKQKAKTTGLN